MVEVLEKTIPEIEEITLEMRIKESIKFDLETKQTNLDIRKYLPNLFKGIIEPNSVGNYPDLDWRNIKTIDRVLNRLYEDWNFLKEKREYPEETGVKEQIRGLLIEWLILKSVSDLKGNKDQDIFEFYKPGGEYADAVLRTDMIARFKLGEEWKSIRLDITTSPSRRGIKYQEYLKTLREKGPRAASLPVLFPRDALLRDQVIIKKVFEGAQNNLEKQEFIAGIFLKDLGLLLLEEMRHGNIAWDSKKLVDVFKKIV